MGPRRVFESGDWPALHAHTHDQPEAHGFGVEDQRVGLDGVLRGAPRVRFKGSFIGADPSERRPCLRLPLLAEAVAVGDFEEFGAHGPFVGAFAGLVAFAGAFE